MTLPSVSAVSTVSAIRELGGFVGDTYLAADRVIEGLSVKARQRVTVAPKRGRHPLSQAANPCSRNRDNPAFTLLRLDSVRESERGDHLAEWSKSPTYGQIRRRAGADLLPHRSAIQVHLEAT